jgi:hypothetical protein
MKSDYWIKLYHEILDDSKMGTLPDRLWRRCIEVFLLAGRYGGMKKDGILPSTNELAWVLRVEPDDLELDLKQLQSLDILKPIAGGWLVVHFTERQAAVPASERGKAWRQKHAGHDTVTQSERYSNDTFVEAESESESEKEEDQKTPASPAFTSQETAYAVSEWGNNGQAKKCENLYQQVTGQMCIPPSSVNTANQSLQAILDYCQGDLVRAVEISKPVFQRWCSSTRKDGQHYSRTNTNWLEKVLETLAPGVESVSTAITPEQRVLQDMERIQRQLK